MASLDLSGSPARVADTSSSRTSSAPARKFGGGPAAGAPAEGIAACGWAVTKAKRERERERERQARGARGGGLGVGAVGWERADTSSVCTVLLYIVYTVYTVITYTTKLDYNIYIKVYSI